MGVCACPVTGVNATCDTPLVGGGGAGAGICAKIPGAGGGAGTPDRTFNCALDRNGGTGTADIVQILNAAADFEASGTDAGGTAFCCKMAGNPWAGMAVRYVDIKTQGTPQIDSIEHTYVDPGMVVWNLINPAAWIFTDGIANGNAAPMSSTDRTWAATAFTSG
jgi:hypothetical protein